MYALGKGSMFRRLATWLADITYYITDLNQAREKSSQSQPFIKEARASECKFIKNLTANSNAGLGFFFFKTKNRARGLCADWLKSICEVFFPPLQLCHSETPPHPHPAKRRGARPFGLPLSLSTLGLQSKWINMKLYYKVYRIMFRYVFKNPYSQILWIWVKNKHTSASHSSFVKKKKKSLTNALEQFFLQRRQQNHIFKTS